MRVLFWGTPEFATPALEALLGEGFDVVGVVTQPDRPVGRSRSKLEPSAVKRCAIEEGIVVLQPERPRGDEFITQIKALEADVSVVVAYGHILPRAVIDLPRLGTVNIHASLLPALRGAAPIQAAIRQGLTETGVTIMRMVQALDAGPMILQVATPIVDDETYGELALRLSEMGALACVEALALIELGKAAEEEQDEALATYAPKIDRAATSIDWTASAIDVNRTVRAYDPRPGALARLGDQDVKLYGAKLAPRAADQPPGSVTTIDERGFVIACGEGAVQIAAVQPSGKRRMSPAEWARGRGIAVGDRFATARDR